MILHTASGEELRLIVGQVGQQTEIFEYLQTSQYEQAILVRGKNEKKEFYKVRRRPEAPSNVGRHIPRL